MWEFIFYKSIRLRSNGGKLECISSLRLPTQEVFVDYQEKIIRGGNSATTIASAIATAATAIATVVGTAATNRQKVQTDE
ncbi:putative auxin efflux carrier component 5c [Dirofilaria immitis]